MHFDDEIVRAVKHQAALDDTLPKKTDDEINQIIEIVRSAVSSNHYDFTTSTSQILTQPGGKKRYIKQYTDCYSTESILCRCIKQVIDRTFHIRYPSRNKSVHSVFDILKAVKQMTDFTIIKCDFKDYFNSVSAHYVYTKYIKNRIANRFEADLIEEFAKQTKYTYAGFSTSNAIAEIIAKHFDSAIKLAFADRGILFYERYIDDTLIVFNEHIDDGECRQVLESALKSIYHDDSVRAESKCWTRFNYSKYIHITRRRLIDNPNMTKTFNYLGYEFTFVYNPDSNKNQFINLTYGVTKAKRDKYKRRLGKLIALFTHERINGTTNPDYKNLELLRHRIAAFTSRIVYQSRGFQQTVWKTKGFINDYGELRYLIKAELVNASTIDFLNNVVINAFTDAGITIPPYFMSGPFEKSGYNLLRNMRKFKTLLLVERIGHSDAALKKLCSQVGINLTDRCGRDRGYGNLVRDYLIKVKVGY